VGIHEYREAIMAAPKHHAGLPFAALVLLASSSCSRSTDISFTHVTVIDVVGGSAWTDMTVTLSGNRITKSAPGAPPTGRVVDGTGKFLIPGLWDMHVHWADEEYLTTFTVNGVTGIRLMNGFPEHLTWRQHIESGSEVGPRMRIAGPLVDGAKPTYPIISVAAATADDARAAVQMTKATGFDFVKSYSGLSHDAFLALADECRRQNIPFAGHVPDSVDATEFAEQGGVSMEHLRRIDFACTDLSVDPNNPPDLVAVDQAYDATKALDVFAMFKALGTWQCPTLVISYKQLVGNPDLPSDPRLQYLPPSLQSLYQALPLTPRRPPDQADTILTTERTIVAGLQSQGVGLLAGTDTPGWGVFPGSSLHEELALLVAAGLSPLQALQSATINPARFIGMDNDLGSVQPGKLADLVLLDANPLDDIHNTTQIRAVVQNGKLLTRSDLDAMLADLQAKAASGQDSHPWPATN
jgi:imidazolonepropionase-like amidohydrolase